MSDLITNYSEEFLAALDVIVGFLKVHWFDVLSFIVGLIGAAAWIPTVVSYYKIKKRKIVGNIVDYRVIADAEVENAEKTEKANGTILMLGLNLFIAHESFFAHNCKIEVKLKDDKKYTGKIIDGTLIEKSNGTRSTFSCPKEYNFNLHREIIAEQDNVRIIPFIVEDATFKSINEVQQISITLKNDSDGSKYSKTIVFSSENFPGFNHMKFISEHFSAYGTVSTFRR